MLKKSKIFFAFIHFLSLRITSFLLINYNILFKKNNCFLFVDIDNTIALTWQSLNEKKFKTERERILNIKVNNKVKIKIDEICMNYKVYPIYISVRPLYTYFTTRKWLKINFFKLSSSNLILVSSPDEKYKIINKLMKYNKKIFYFDDLSYNHENGKTLFHQDTIDKIRTLDIDYFDYKFINSI
jgi:hypothetical protein